ncbi:MAG: hypothetical protein SPE74_05920 [Oscillospiraceae bacterium]|nr:hypothetical protein [Oscillospiraceae bacterium]
MSKRILSATLAALLLLALLPVSVGAAGSYTMGLSPESSTVGRGDTVTIRVDLSQSEAKTYNAYDVTLSWDRKLTLVKAINADGQKLDLKNVQSSLRIKGYGDDKAVSTPVAELTFSAGSSGMAKVQVDKAFIDRSANAIRWNATELRSFHPKSAEIIVNDVYRVTLAQGLTAETYEVADGESYTFKASDYDCYDYTVTAKVGGTEIKTLIDNGDGSYTIPAASITGDITVEATRTPKTYTVTFNGSGKSDAKGEESAVYNTPYSFELSRDGGYKYTVSIKIGGKAYTGYKLATDTYTIPGTDITGSIVITVTKTKATGTGGGTTSGAYQVTFAGNGADDASGNKTAKRGVAYSFKLKKLDGFRYEVSVQIGGKEAVYTYNQETDTYTIPAASITGNITIVVTRIVEPSVTEYITLDGQSIYLIFVPAPVEKGHVAKFDGMSMFHSDAYPGFTWLLQTDEDIDTVRQLAESKVSIAEGKAEAEAKYTGDVDLSGRMDMDDAELVHDMYSTHYLLADLPTQEFLRADVNADRRVNVQDVEWILYSLKTQQQGGTT